MIRQQKLGPGTNIQMVNEAEHQLGERIDARVDEEDCGVQEATIFPKNAERFQQVFVLGEKLRQQV